MALPLVQDTFRLTLPGVLALDSFATTSVRKLIFLFPTSADGRSSHFRLRVLANHLASIVFPPLSGDSLGYYMSRYPILYPSGHQVQTSVCFHSDLDLLLRD